ncbi:MAG: hypothetical protein IAE84_19260 [Saprospiraceae bacterium]|nr:hypothetical protein [Saprospiraceae bacterium]HRD80965.1 hypothetical protein [Saprospiraceae bacterium]HRF38903.1 hypothetical protein [Saprospiraceae bacterium]HRK83667.1 hypothetical protein [Saprospiraceae bacterium]
MFPSIKKILPAALLLLAVGCRQDPHRLMAGHWQVVDISSKEELPEYRLDDFRFFFTEDGRYQYFGNLYYEEAGVYTVEGSYLHTTDTLRQDTGEKTVQILKLTKDSLFLRMADETTMKLAKDKIETPK